MPKMPLTRNQIRSRASADPEIWEDFLSQHAPTVPYEEFEKEFVSVWDQGQHVVEIGPAGQGKTTLGLRLIQARAKFRKAEVVVFATKPKDPSLRKLGWPIIRKWPPGFGQDQVILWPEFKDPDSAVRNQRRVFMQALRDIFSTGGRTLYFDEEFYLESELKMTHYLNQFWSQSRSLDITMIAGTQRPRSVTRQMFANASWAIFFKTHDEDDLKRVGEIAGGANTDLVRECIRRLNKYEFLIIQRDSGRMLRSMVE